MYVEDFFRIGFRAQFWLDFFETGLDGCFHRELELYSFWTRSVQELRSWGSRKLKNFWKMKAWPQIFLKLNKLIICYVENWSFEIFDPIEALGWELGTKTLLKTGLYRNFNNSLPGFWLNLAERRKSHDEWSDINFEDPWAVQKKTWARNASRKRYCESKETQCQKFLSDSV